MIEGHKTNYILDADIKGFFDNLNHDWIMKFISSRITDNSVLRLVEKMLKAGILKNGEFYVYSSNLPDERLLFWKNIRL